MSPESTSNPSRLALAPASPVSASPAELVRAEAAALLALAERLDGPMANAFEQAVQAILECGKQRGRVVVTGVGKSGMIAQKIAATLASTGTPALFLHPSDALHGDLGMMTRGDIVLALSASGATEELLRLLPALKRTKVPLLAKNEEFSSPLLTMTGELHSPLALASDVVLDASIEAEACALGLAPTASTTTMLALGDALAVAVSVRKGFCAEDFAALHPGGRLGKRLMRVEERMHCGDAIPRVSPDTPMRDVIYEMSRKGLGMTTVVDGDRLLGLLSDGDLRRLLESGGETSLQKTASAVMNPHPVAIGPNELVTTALARMEEHRITSLVVLEEAGRLLGVVHLHDLWDAERGDAELWDAQRGDTQRDSQPDTKQE